MHRIVGDQSDGRAVGTLQPNQSDLPIGWTIGIEPERNFAVGVPRAAVDVGARHSGADGDARGRQLLARLTNALDQFRFYELTVLAIPRMFGTALEQDVVHSGRTDFRRRVAVRDGPPHLLRLDAELFLQLGRDFVVHGWREQTQVGGDDKNLGRAVVERGDAMVNGIADAG